MAKAKWTVGVPTRNVAADGTATASVPLLDNGVLAATLRLTITADRAMTLLVENEPGTAGLTGFQAWSNT